VVGLNFGDVHQCKHKHNICCNFNKSPIFHNPNVSKHHEDVKIERVQRIMNPTRFIQQFIRLIIITLFSILIQKKQEHFFFLNYSIFKQVIYATRDTLCLPHSIKGDNIKERVINKRTVMKLF